MCCNQITRSLISKKALASASKPNKTTDIQTFLLNSGRKIHPIIGDGNCLFRAISYAILNTEDHHFMVRSHIVRLINLNSSTFSQYLMPINQPTITEQVKYMSRPCVWGTHLEVKAAATLFKLPIFFCTQSSQNGPFSWSVVQPITPGNISFPIITEETFGKMSITLKCTTTRVTTV